MLEVIFMTLIMFLWHIRGVEAYWLMASSESYWAFSGHEYQNIELRTS